ncbi:MAG: bifunctional phosphopantothenoylcysteine decarboxylase/phosphopantothenate--cysteine ligase CoaBC [Proteobacteria bacterium]|nr:bifunctional phosphopantothenoylcysteine decarboxylase/phosphopantothenate--cysteine ligase CoaBC [Pseudomonadota bacterium]
MHDHVRHRKETAQAAPLLRLQRHPDSGPDVAGEGSVPDLRGLGFQGGRAYGLGPGQGQLAGGLCQGRHGQGQLEAQVFAQISPSDPDVLQGGADLRLVDRREFVDDDGRDLGGAVPVSVGLKNRRVLLGVTGGIAAYKSADLTSRLAQAGAEVRLVMTAAARAFVSPLTFQALSGQPVSTDLFDEAPARGMGHIELGQWAEAAVVAPATANFLAKAATGIADDLLSTLMLVVTAPVVVCPAMNVNMYRHATVGENLSRLRARGVTVLGPDEGPMACGDFGPGRMVEPAVIAEALAAVLGPADLAGRKILVTAGPTREAVDPVRFLSNRSTGRMGVALAREARRRGGTVTLVLGPTEIEPPWGVETVRVVSATDMHRQVTARAPDMDLIVMNAAVADYTPARVREQKIKKATANLSGIDLTSTLDILAELGARKPPGQILVGFAAETEKLVPEARSKLERKNLDLVVANNVALPGVGFATETNQVILVHPHGEAEKLPLMPKAEVALEVFDRVVRLLPD